MTRPWPHSSLSCTRHAGKPRRCPALLGLDGQGCSVPIVYAYRTARRRAVSGLRPTWLPPGGVLRQDSVDVGVSFGEFQGVFAGEIDIGAGLVYVGQVLTPREPYDVCKNPYPQNPETLGCGNAGENGSFCERVQLVNHEA